MFEEKRLGSEECKPMSKKKVTERRRVRRGERKKERIYINILCSYYSETVPLPDIPALVNGLKETFVVPDLEFEVSELVVFQTL